MTKFSILNNRNLFPDNIVEMAFQEYETNYAPEYKFAVLNITSNETKYYKFEPGNTNINIE